ncbi:hypothetical protein [Robertkochia solimangrovi]|uniref:hypothetical protein n=1 Tax=Robertkochia solimangrovi TaxID=2213046 RepID=UPI00117C1B8E|nr:hypothetical protein [Robertkochia solimangrovi]TRZ42815.1 hypothetical protein DMZ48_12150 [Robertkochia solimangrovi]
MERSEKEQEDFLRSFFDDKGKRMPPVSMKQNIMKSIAGMQSLPEFSPLISPLQWVLIALIAVGVIGYSLMEPGSEDAPGYLSRLKPGYERVASFFGALEISDVAMYGIIILAIFLIIEFSILKNLIDRRYKA